MANEANRAFAISRIAITKWAQNQVKDALAKKGITPCNSIVSMMLRKKRNGRTVLEQTECLFDGVGRVDPPTIERGALGKNVYSTSMRWCALIHWRNIRKDGTPGALYDSCMIFGDSCEEIVAQIELVRDLETT